MTVLLCCRHFVCRFVSIRQSIAVRRVSLLLRQDDTSLMNERMNE